MRHTLRIIAVLSAVVASRAAEPKAPDAPADIDATDGYGLTALHHAVKEGKLATVKELLAGGANINAQDKFGLTPLAHAVNERKTDIARTLLEHDADPNLSGSEDRETPLHIVGGQAVRSPANSQADRDLVSMLVQFKADASRKNKSGFTPLWQAHWRRRDDVVEAMLDAGVAPDIFTLLELKRGDQALALLRADPAAAKARYFDDRTPLHLAAALGQDEIAELLIKAGASLDARDHYKRTPLHAAAAAGHADVTERLLKAGAKVDPVSAPPWEFIGGLNRWCNGNFTPLHLAARSHPAVAKTLIEYKADINARDGFGCTPLHWAAATGDAETVEILVAAGAKLNLRCQAAEDVIMEIGRAKEESPAATPLAIAKQKHFEKIAAYLATHGAKKEPDEPPPKPQLLPRFPSLEKSTD